MVGSWPATIRVDSVDALRGVRAHRGKSPAPHNLLALFWRGANTGGTASRPRRRLRASRVDGKRWLWKVGRAV